MAWQKDPELLASGVSTNRHPHRTRDLPEGRTPEHEGNRGNCRTGRHRLRAAAAAESAGACRWGPQLSRPLWEEYLGVGACTDHETRQDGLKGGGEVPDSLHECKRQTGLRWDSWRAMAAAPPKGLAAEELKGDAICRVRVAISMAYGCGDRCCKNRCGLVGTNQVKQPVNCSIKQKSEQLNVKRLSHSIQWYLSVLKPCRRNTNEKGLEHKFCLKRSDLAAVMLDDNHKPNIVAPPTMFEGRSQTRGSIFPSKPTGIRKVPLTQK